MNNALNPKITMMATVSANSIAGRVVLNGKEWAVTIGTKGFKGVFYD